MSHRAVLIALARRCQIADRRAATGLCLTSSLELALAAARRGIAVSLVRWRVRDDAHFVDHWCVRLDGRHVLDLTRAQVDGSSRLVVGIDDYPANYVDCRHYPASLFLDAYAKARQAGRTTLPSAFVLGMARVTFRHDVMTAVRAFFPVRVLELAAEFAVAHLRVGRTALLGHLGARRERLERRLG